MAELLHISPPPPGRPSLPVELDERPARAALRDQIARLEERLASHVTTAFPLSPSPALVGGTSGATFLTLAELESRRDALAARVSDVRRELDALGAQQELARGRLERIMLDPAAHPWERVTNADIGEPGCRQVHARPRFGIFGAMLDWWRVRISSGCPLCMARSRSSQSPCTAQRSP